MKLSELMVRTLLGWIALVAARMLAGIVFPVKASAVGRVLLWWAGASLLIATAMAFAAARSDWRGWRLGLALSSIPLAVDFINAIEGIVFFRSGFDWPHILLQLLLSLVLLAPLWAVVFGKGREVALRSHRPFGSRTLAAKLWRFAVSDFFYVFLYFTAGMIIFPLVRGFYLTQTLPSNAEIFSLQVLLRGPLLVAVCLVLARMIGRPRAAGALATGVVFAVLSGVAPLMVPSAYFPDSVRWVHFYEVSGSNFLFATFVAWLWLRGAPEPLAVHLPASGPQA